MIGRTLGFATIALFINLGFTVHAALPEEQLVSAVKVVLGKGFSADWSGLEALPGIKWAPLPPASLDSCLPDGGCFTRQGVARFGDRKLVVIASGARTLVTNIYFSRQHKTDGRKRCYQCPEAGRICA